MSFNLDLPSLIIDMNDRFYYGGFLADVEISEDRVIEYFRDNSKDFEIIGEEFIKKINKYKVNG